MRRGPPKSLKSFEPAEEEDDEEEGEMEFDMDDIGDDLAGLSLEDLLSPEEIEVVTQLAPLVMDNKLDDVKSTLAKAVSLGMKAEILVNAPLGESDGLSLTLMSFARGSLDMAKLMVESGGDPVAVSESGDSCFSIASQQGHVQLVEYLLEKGHVKLFGSIDDNGNGALHLAAQGHVDVLKLILDKGAFINVPSAETKTTALHHATQAGRPENVKLLLEKNADVNKANSLGRTPLMYCLNVPGEKAIEIATLLLEKKADLHKVDMTGATAYDLAESYFRYDVALFLLSRGAIPRGVPANTIGVDTFHIQPYFQVGDRPSARTRATSVVRGSTLYVAGGLVTLSHEDLEAALHEAGDDFDEADIIPFRPCADIYSTDLSKIGMKPMVGDLSKLKATHGSTIKLSDVAHGEHLHLIDPNVVTVKYDPHHQEHSENCEHNHEEDPHDHSHDTFATSILASDSFSAENGPIAYYEVTVLEGPAENMVASIGWTDQPGEWDYDIHPGWDESSAGFHSDDGKFRILPPQDDMEGDEPLWLGNIWKVGDTVGAGFIFETEEIFFTLNGRFLGIASDKTVYRATSVRPVIGFGSDKVTVRANFGAQAFRFNFHVPTVQWSKLADLPANVLALLPAPGSDEIIVIPDSTKSYYVWNPVSGNLVTKDVKANKIQGIPLHTEHSVEMIGNKVVLFIRKECLLDQSKKRNTILMTLDTTTNTWTDLLAPATMPSKKLAKTLADCQGQLSAGAINGNYYVFATDKAFQINLANLTVTAVKLTGLPPNEDMDFSYVKDNISLCYTMTPNLSTYYYILVDIAKKQWFLPRFSGISVEPLVGKSVTQYDGKLYSFAGFAGETTMAKNSFMSIAFQRPDTSGGVAAAFNDSSKSFHSDVVVKVGDSSLHLHKAILAARSEFFSKALQGGATEIQLDASFDTKLATAVLKYLYTNTIDITLANATNFKPLIAIAEAIAPAHVKRITEEILFTRTFLKPTLSDDLLRLKDSFSDITIEATGGSVKAHKAILAIRAEGLKEKLASSPASITLSHSIDTVKHLINALYTACTFNLADVPRSEWDSLATLATEIKCNCIVKAIENAKIISVEPSSSSGIPQVVPI